MKVYIKYSLVYTCIWLITAWGAIAQTDTQDIRFDRLTSENIKLVKGLSQNWVYSILQDKQGYIWFGTWDGLNKYDGYNFTIYNVANGLSDHTILSMVEDFEGNLWIGTGEGLNKFERNKQSFKHFPQLTSDSIGLYHHRVNHILYSSDSLLWLGTGGGLVKFDPRTGKFERFLTSQQEYFSPRSNYILHICEDNNRNLWISTTYGLVIFNPKTNRSTRYYHSDQDENSLSDNNIRFILQEKSGNFWIATRNGLNHFDTLTRKMKRYFHDATDPHSIGGNFVRVIYEDRSGTIWFGTESGGLSKYIPEKDHFFTYKNLIADKSSLSNNRIYSIFEDLAGNLWVGTYKGVNKVSKYINSFTHYHTKEEEPDGLSSNFIWDFQKDDEGNLWLATSDGINIQSAETDKFLQLNYQVEGSVTTSENEIRTLLYTPQYNCFWFGTFGSGIDQYNLDTKSSKKLVANNHPNSLSNDYVNDMIVDSSGYIWIATGRGLNRFDPATNTFRHFFNDKQYESSISHDISISLFEDSDHNIWVGTSGGLNKFDPATEKFTRYFDQDSNKIASNTFFYITQDAYGTIWSGTSGGGLIKLNPQTGEYKNYTEADGLPNNVIYGILEDDENNLWLSSNRGLVKFYPIGEKVVVYDVKDGIQSYEFNLGSSFKDEEGYMYFGGMNGYNVFHPKEIVVNPTPPVVVISSFKKFNEPHPFELSNEDTITLKHDENFFSFEVSALDYTNPVKNQYRYYLEGVDPDWIFADANSRIAEYKKVQPGSYTFHASGSNSDGVWNNNGVNVRLIIVPPWYATWFFRIAMIIFVVFSVYYAIYRRIRQIKRKHEVEKKLLEIEKQKFELEQKALRLQMNPHFIFNSLNSIQSYIVSHDAELAVNYLGKFAQLMRLILNNSGNTYIPINEELKAIEYYLDLEKLRFDNKFDYELSIDKNIDTEFMEIPPMVVQPYIENAIIHGFMHKKDKGLLKIDFILEGQSIRCTIEDNGVGRDFARQKLEETGLTRRSSGMYITRARLELINQDQNKNYSVKITDLRNDNKEPKGTRVDLIIKFNEE